MKIALLTDGIYPYVMGGMQKHSYYLIKYFAQQQILVDFYHYIPDDKLDLPLPFTETELKYINEVRLDYPKTKKFPGHYLYERYQYSKVVLEQFKQRGLPDFIYCKGFAGWALLKNKKQLNLTTPIGVNFHGYEMFQKWPDVKTGLKLQILKLPVLYHMKRADVLFSYGGKISELIKSKGFGHKIISIPTGISKDWIAENTISEDTTQDTIKFCFVGRAERRKGIEELNLVLSALKHKHNFEFHFIGPIPEQLQIQESQIVYHGPIYDQDQIKSTLQDMDVLVCPSYSEGMPNVILEGMASACAIIATDVGAVSEMVSSDNGRLIDKNHIAKDLEQAMRYYIDIDSDVLSQQKQNSMLKVKAHFTWEQVITQTIDKLNLYLN